MEDVVWGMVEAVNTRLFESHSSSEHFAADFVVELRRTPGKKALATHYKDVQTRLDGQPGTVISLASNCFLQRRPQNWLCLPPLLYGSK